MNLYFNIYLQAPRKLNLNIIAYFLEFMTKMAEGVTESAAGQFTWY